MKPENLTRAYEIYERRSELKRVKDYVEEMLVDTDFIGIPGVEEAFEEFRGMLLEAIRQEQDELDIEIENL